MARRKPAGRAPSPRPKRPPQKRVTPAPQRTVVPPAPLEARTFRLGIVPGATPGKWIDIWHDRMPHVAIDLVALDAATAQKSVLSDAVDAALLRLPVNDVPLHVIRLYDEAPVVVASTESHLLAADELTASDLAGETVIVPGDDVLGAPDIPGALAPRFGTLERTADAIATAASGAGIVIVPMSLARLHDRKDAGHRPLRGGPVSTMALVWRRDDDNPDIQTFIGIVRGRTAQSSR